jgi:LDH2 family malate/lactate/ureidoglycolate dehydrogenase
MTVNPKLVGTLLQVEPLKRLAATVYQQAGVPAIDAELAADALVQADLWGHQSHGLLRLGWYYARLKSGAMRGGTHVTTVTDAGAIAVLDGNDGVGPVIAQQATDEAVRRARLHGVGIVSVRHSNHFGTCMYFTRSGAQAGCAMLMMSNGGPNMAPWGGLQKKIGTNPWSIAVPAGQHAPMVMDIANSGVARGKIYLANNRHEPIPENWAVDAQGNPTTDPKEALKGFILPMAGHKGYAIGVMVDVMSGVLSGSGFQDQVHGPYDPVNRSRAGHFIMAIDIDKIQPLSEFNARMDEYIASLKSVPVAASHKKVYYPGEIEAEADEHNRRVGLRLPPDTLEDLARVCEDVGLSFEDYVIPMI